MPLIENSTKCLGGMTNNSYKFEYEGEQYILRSPGNRTGDYIDRQAEALNAKIAYDFGIGPEVIYCDAESGIMVTRFISGATTPGGDDLKHPAMLRRVVDIIKTLHNKGAVLTGHFDPFKTIERYVKYLKKRGGETPRDYDIALFKARSIREALESSRREPTACHVDTVPENFLDTGERIFLLDWEYAGNGDAFWDLATLSIEAMFDGDDEKRLLEMYLGEVPSAPEAGRLFLYKIVCDLVWTPWAAIQTVNGNRKFDYWSYATERCNRALNTMERAEFEHQLRAVQ